MTFKDNVAKSGNRASRGGMSRGGMIAGGGGIGTLILVGAFLLLGGDPSQLGSLVGGQSPNQLPAGQNQQAPEGVDNCQTGADANSNVDCRLEFTAISLDKVWQTQLPDQAGIDYEKPGLTLFNQQVQTGCGIAGSSTGPFYCPRDRTAYFDSSFFRQIEQLGGSNAPLAQEYIVAHEFGHHIQNLEGNLGLSDYSDPGADSNAVKIELQADCYGGVWAHYADKGEDALLEPITDEQLLDAVETARAVGDDNIQQRTRGQVNPDGFTHGTSQQRQEAFLAGYNSGRMASCDFLGTGGYR
ncbi:neutral zinc metallopeptidase [Corynebacterium mendelii]|uniref:Neutral zinc metallopeptidase n=1 Tax=Corynebacterium mendelii TaxID=2765362 RepID=A0A939E0P0_9CORY|nr:neutral zinc metallopeptidase [Corynebacterium mendelii]MBN9643392.1 neutral zinc metallopeptidase [Corynebacterium mendelii]